MRVPAIREGAHGDYYARVYKAMLSSGLADPWVACPSQSPGLRLPAVATEDRFPPDCHLLKPIDKKWLEVSFILVLCGFHNV